MRKTPSRLDLAWYCGECIKDIKASTIWKEWIFPECNVSLLEGWLNEIVSNFQPPRLVTLAGQGGWRVGSLFLSGGSLSLGSFFFQKGQKINELYSLSW